MPDRRFDTALQDFLEAESHQQSGQTIMAKAASSAISIKDHVG